MVNGGVQKEKQKEKDAKKDKNGKHAKHDAKRDAKHDAKHERSGKLGESKDKPKRDRHGPCAAEALDEEVQGGSTGSHAMPSKSRSPARIQLKSSPEAEKVSEKAPKAPEPVKPVNPRQSSDHSDSESSGERRRKRREHAGLKAASGFGLAPSEPQLSLLEELFASLSSCMIFIIFACLCIPQTVKFIPVLGLKRD